MSFEVLGRGAGAEPRPVEVHAHFASKFRRAHVLGGGGVTYPGVGDEDIDLAPEIGHDALKDGADGRFVADVALVGSDGDPVGRRQVGRELVGRRGAAVDTRDRGPGFSVGLDDFETDAS